MPEPTDNIFYSDLLKAVEALPSPCYIVDERLLVRNLEVLRGVRERSGCRILLALKGFATHEFFPLIGEYLDGVTASSLFEARLGREKMGKQVHVYAPAYVSGEFDELAGYCDHIVFNSPAQWQKYRRRAQTASCGIRVNPEYSEIATPLYDPCYANSRLGTTLAELNNATVDGIEGLHFHTMCEQNSGTLERTAKVVDEKFGPYISRVRWLNMGGGHHITRADYDIGVLLRVIAHFRDKYGVDVYLEPGEAVALNTGFLAASVLDVVHNGMDIAILDTSAACHMPDVLEMPYRPVIAGAGRPDEFAYTYRLGGLTCLAGDVIGDYSFPQPLKPGDKLIFTDMAHYTMVKNNMFNGVNLPSIAKIDGNGVPKLIKSFGYADYESRLS